MNMSFYHMTHGYSNHYARAKGRIGKYERHPCEVCEANHIIELENTRVEIHGKKHADYYWIPGRHIISPAFQQLLEENNVSGYHLQDIQLVDCDDFSQEGLKELVVTGRSGYLKDINGNYYKRCPKCDAIDYSFLRTCGLYRIDKEKFVESFVYRFANSVDATRSYTIGFYDINEMPPKVSVKVDSETTLSFKASQGRKYNENPANDDAYVDEGQNISTSYDAILEVNKLADPVVDEALRNNKANLKAYENCKSKVHNQNRYG